MADVDIGNDTFYSWADLDTATTYLEADPGDAANAFRALVDDNARGRYLVSATRILARQPWPAGVIVDPLPDPLVDAAIELAAAMAGGYDAANQQSTTATSTKREKAGSVEIEYFYDGGSDAGLRFPLPVWELISPFLAGAGSSSGFGGSKSSGTCGRSAFIPGFGIIGAFDDDYSRDVD